MEGRRASLSEAARRLLRREGCTIEVPDKFASQANALALHISDSLPSLLREPEVWTEIDWNYVCISRKGDLIARIGGPEPSLDVCWISIVETELDDMWDEFRQIISDLLIAGYPGCIDCAGPAATEPWDERSRRDEF